MGLPLIIQGGMGAGVSNWRLAKAVSQKGQLGVVSGTALDSIFIRRLQLGDPGGHMRRALSHFPAPHVSEKILNDFFITGGKADHKPFKRIPLYTLNPSPDLQKITIAANFVEVFLAKENHDGIVGINYLEKIQFPNLFSIYGAMLAGVDYVLMGAGIPVEIPGVLDKFVHHEEASLKINVEGADPNDDYRMRFNPKMLFPYDFSILKRPKFLAIISSVTLAMALLKRAKGAIYGFVIEGPTAGGHNAPPRGKLPLSEKGEPIYTEKDHVDLKKIRSLGRPFWLAGSFNSPEHLEKALNAGADGIQVGTAFAFSKESGFSDNIKQKVLQKALKGEIQVFTDPRASPSGFPFKVILLEGTASEEKVYQARPKGCDLGYLRRAYKIKGSLGYRCPSECPEDFIKKGGDPEDIIGRKCLCNTLTANIGLAQIQKDGYLEKPLITAGNDFSFLHHLIKNSECSYSVQDVISYLLNQ